MPPPSCPLGPRPDAVCCIAHEEDRRSGVNVREVPGGAGEGSSRPWFHSSGASEDGGGFPSGAGVAGDARRSLEGGTWQWGTVWWGTHWAGLDLNPPRTLSRVWLVGVASGPTGRQGWVREPRRGFLEASRSQTHGQAEWAPLAGNSCLSDVDSLWGALDGGVGLPRPALVLEGPDGEGAALGIRGTGGRGSLRRHLAIWCRCIT